MDVTSLKRLSMLSWPRRREYNCPGYYKVCAVSKAAGILSARKKSLKRGVRTKDPYSLRPMITAYHGFKVRNGELQIPLGERRFHRIPLTRHTLSLISDPALTVRSFTITSTSLSLCVSKEVSALQCVGAIGVDNNLRNLTVGNSERVVQYDLSKAVRIAHTTTRILRSFKRNDDKVRRRLSSKYGRRRQNRIHHLLHNVTKHLVKDAVQHRHAIVLENMTGIRRLYVKGGGRGRNHRRRMNGWSFRLAQQQITYKARWLGLPVIRLTVKETMGTSTTCPQCGERLLEDEELKRKLYCRNCRTVIDRDVVAAVNLSRRGRLRFDRSRAVWLKGGAGEVVKGNPTPTVIPGVDAPKSGPKGQYERSRLDGIVKVTRKW